MRYPLVLLATASVASCGVDLQPSERVSALYLSVRTAEWEEERNIMLVGENGSASVATETNENCVFVMPPCENSADVKIQSSAPDVVSAASQRLRSPASVALVANGPGTATLTATADGLTESRRIDVVSAPLPLDAIRANLDPETDLPFQNDPLGSLAAVEAPVGEVVFVNLTAVRDEQSVNGIIFQISSSAPGIVSACGSVSPCEAQDGWGVVSVSPGDAEITVSARNLTTGFTVHVVEAP